MVRRRVLLVLVAVALGAVATQVTARVMADRDVSPRTSDVASERHVAVPAAAVRAARALDTPWEPAVGLSFAVVVAAFAFACRREQIVPSRRVLWDAGDEWRSLLLGAPPAA